MFESAAAQAKNRISSLIESGPLHTPDINVGQPERILSIVGGSVLAGYGLSRQSLGGLILAGLGGSLLYRGLTGHCPMYGLLDINTANQARGDKTSIPAGEGVRIEESITIDSPAEEVYDYWRNLENLPKIMRHLESVEEEGKRSHWVAAGPLGVPAEWDAEIITERENELIGWRSLPGSPVATAGSVHFNRVGNGTRVDVELKYEPPAGKVGAAVAKFFGADPAQEIREDLDQFKNMLEGGRTERPNFTRTKRG